MTTSTLCVLAHPDDEMAMASRIALETSSGRAVRCIVLTDGGAGGVLPVVRERESLEALRRLGVAPSDVHFVGGRHGVADGGLVEALERVLPLVDDLASGWTFDQVFALAWEGGHPDHDAAHLLALAVARRRGLLDRTWQFPLYHGRGMPGGTFRVMSPLHPLAARRRRLSMSEALRVARLPLLYASQRSTWMGLGPEALVKLLLLRREVMSAASIDAVATRPHDGRLLSERRFGVDYAAWRAHADPFIARHVVAP